uniref:Uncharacterized protein n=1 Tax=Anguilla anguilla TaxID=7936 RepID=A0A0E9VXC6_ANGAN
MKKGTLNSVSETLSSRSGVARASHLLCAFCRSESSLGFSACNRAFSPQVLLPVVAFCILQPL